MGVKTTSFRSARSSGIMPKPVLSHLAFTR
jgi:hypothetical protein